MTSGGSGSSASTPGAASTALSYNRFIAGLHTAGIEVDRKVLADLAVSDPAAFGALVERAKAAVDEKAANAAPSESAKQQAS